MNFFQKILGFFSIPYNPRLAGHEGKPIPGDDDSPAYKLYQSLSASCPDCGLKPPQYMEGPSGGMTTNIFCGACGHGFNVAPVIQWAERIKKDEHYILPEFRIKRNAWDQARPG